MHHLVVRHLGVVEVEDVLHLGRLEPAHGLQVDDRAHLPGEAQPVAAAQHRLGTDRRDDRVAAVDRRQEDAGQVPQPGLLDRLAVHRTAGLHHHLDGEPPRRLLQLGHRRAASRQHAWCQRDDGADPDDRDRHADRADLEEAHRLEAGVDHLPRDDEVGRRADQRGHAAQQRRERQRHQQLAHRHLAPLGPRR